MFNDTENGLPQIFSYRTDVMGFRYAVVKKRTFSGTDNLRKVYFFMRHLDELAFSGFSILIC